MRKFVLSENTIDCPSCDGDGTQNCLGYADCIDCDGEGQINPTFWDGDFVKHKHQDLQGWIVGFDGCKAIVEIDDDEDEETTITCSVEELEQGE